MVHPMRGIIDHQKANPQALFLYLANTIIGFNIPGNEAPMG
jgi:hypothetical protein